MINQLLKGKKRIALAFTGHILLTALFPNAAFAQYTLDEQVSFVYINGTSTLHDWTASVEQMKGTLQAEVEGSHLVKISSAKISIPAITLKSGKEAMDKNMYKALKSDSYPEITY
ncbi:YceI family protein [Flavobacteriales bacterium]|nr:YceI family protein [Flavobacteriales bacterium]